MGRELLETGMEFAKSGGTVSMAEARELWELALDGPGVTPTEKKTLEYILKTYKFTAPAAKFMKEKLEAASAACEKAKEAIEVEEEEEEKEDEKKEEEKKDEKKEEEKKEDAK